MSVPARWRTYLSASIAAASLMVAVTSASAATGGTGLASSRPASGGGTAPGPAPQPAPPLSTTPLPTAVLSSDGRTAKAPESAPPAVKNVIRAANRITGKPYRFGGGHARFRDRGYDCSGAVSYALRGGRMLGSPLDSRAFASWGDSGPGQWITVYTNPGHAYVVVAGLRFDTSGPGPRGPRWRTGARSSRSFQARHPAGF